MLESLVSAILNRTVGQYIENVSSDQFKVAAWSGNVSLKNLKLKKEALDKFRLPVDVVDGFVQQLELNIPFRYIQTQPVVVKVKNVTLLCMPRAQSNYDEADDERRKQQVKQEKLANAELLNVKGTEGMSEQDAKKQEGFISQLVTKVIDNIQITVENVHFRYEDSLSDPGNTFAAGITLASFTVDSCDANWQKTFVEGNHDQIYKLATLNSLAVYWNTKSKSMKGLAPDQLVEQYGALIARDDDIPSENQYILKPVSGEGKLTLRRHPEKGVPKQHATLLFDELGFVLDDDQYRTALLMIGQFHFYIRQQQYRKYRPIEEPSKAPKEWLRFAGDSVLREIHEKHHRWTWEHFKQRRDDRLAYIAAFKRTATNAAELEDPQKIKDLELKLSYQDIRFYRSIARSELRKEKALHPPASQPQQQGWVSWIWHGGKTATEDDSEFGGMTDDQRKELFQAIEWDEKQAVAASIDLPADFIKVQLEAELKTGSFSLKRDPHSAAGGKDIMSLVFDKLGANILQRPENFAAEVTLGSLGVNDGSTPNTLYPQMVRIKDDSTSTTESMELIKSSDEEEPFFYVMFEHQPLDERADNALTLKMRNMEIIYSAVAVEAIAKFFKPPKSQLESIDALMAVASDTFEGFRDQTRSGLEFALDTHKTIDVRVDMKAPIIIMPESLTDKRSNVLVLDSGHISVTSNLVKKDIISQIQRKQREQYNDEDFKRLESAMYDKFVITLTSTQLLVGNSLDRCLDEIRHPTGNKELHIVDSITMEFELGMSIMPHAPNLTRTRVTGHLPLLQARLSDRKYKTIMRIVDIVIPKSDDEETTDLKSDRVIEKKRIKSHLGIGDDDEDWAHRHLQHDEDDQAQDDDQADRRTIMTVESKYFDASDAASINTSDALKRTSFELSFKVDKLQASILKSDRDPTVPERILAEVVAEHFGLGLKLRTYDLSADVTLKTLYVEDMMGEIHPEFKKIVSSDNSDGEKSVTPNDTFDSHGPKTDGNLIHVIYTKVKEESPEYQPVYEGIDQNVDIAVSTINLVVTRRSILILFDFILTTFTSPEGNKPKGSQTQQQTIVDQEEAAVEGSSEGKIKVRVKLTSIVLILNNDGTRLATLKLSQGDLAVLLRGKSMRVAAKLGNITILDDSVTDHQPFREILAIQGQELADFRYETFDEEDESAYPGYDTSIYLRSGSLQFTFLEEPIRKIMDFGAKFARMKALFDTARQAAMNQATQIQQRSTRMHFDVLISTPIVIFPEDRHTENLIVANLGEISAVNRFAKSKGDDFQYKIDAGLRDIKLTSFLVVNGNHQQDLTMLNNVNFTVELTAYEHIEGVDRPEMEIICNLSDVEMNMTARQYAFLMELSQTIPRTFAGEQAEEEELQPVGSSTTTSGTSYITNGAGSNLHEPAAVVDIIPELGDVAKKDGEIVKVWSKIDLIFKVKTVYLELFTGDASHVTELKDASLARFSLNETNAQYRMVTDGSMEAELQIQSFTVNDTRPNVKTNYREIIPAVNHGGAQFMIKFTMSGGESKHMVALVTVDSPKIIFALDPVFALRDFFTSPFAAKSDEPEEQQPDTAANEEPSKKESTLHYRVNIVDPEIMLLANPEVANSEAIVLATRQILIVQQKTLTLTVDSIGMFLCRMDNRNETLRILDNIDIVMSMESRVKGNQQITNIEFKVDPLILRVSNRDVKLMMSILNKASELSQKSEDERLQEADDEDTAPKSAANGNRPKLKVRSASGRQLTRQLTVPAESNFAETTKDLAQKDKNKTISVTTPSVLMSRESLKAHVSGFQVILIGDEHELPMIDMNVKGFGVSVSDWSSQLKASTSISTYMNFFNLTNSHWEPLIEPWQFSVHAQKQINPDSMNVEMSAKKRLEVNISATFIETLMTSMQIWNKEGDLVLNRARGSNAPYVFQNKSGFDLQVWASGQKSSKAVHALADGTEVQWRFDDWRRMRENVQVGKNTIGIKFQGSEMEPLRDIPVDREGDFPYVIRPAANGVLHRLVVSVHLKNNVKMVTFRSPLVVHNNTQLKMDMVVVDAKDVHVSPVLQIEPGMECPVPIPVLYHHRIKVRPPQDYGYDWSRESLYWLDLQKPNAPSSIVCKNYMQGMDPFRLQVYGKFDRRDPVARKYPFMTIRISAPIEVENLLPYDITYRLYDKNLKADWKSPIAQGGISPLHAVELSHLLLLNVTVKETGLKPSEFSIVNSSNSDDLAREDRLKITDPDGFELNLQLHYHEHPDSGGAFRVSIYSPYVIVNQTGLDVLFKTKTFMQGTQYAAGQALNSANARKPNQPLMFAFNSKDRNSNRNRALMRIGSSQWSKPVSFEAVGSEQEVVVPSSDHNEEIHVGISITEGHSKYKFTKIVTLTPRFVMKNTLGEDICFREPGTTKIFTVKNTAVQPIRFMRAGAEKQLVVGFAGQSDAWTSPFDIQEVGRTYVRIKGKDNKEQLLKIDIQISKATLYIHVNAEQKNRWPYKVENLSNAPVRFFQMDPDAETEGQARTMIKSRKYDLSPGEAIPYAWDQPAARMKRLMLEVNGKSREINISEIGVLVPFKYPRRNRQLDARSAYGVMAIEIAADGPTQVLKLSDYRKDESLFKLRSHTPSPSGSSTDLTRSDTMTKDFEVADVKNEVGFTFTTRFEGVGISLINRKMQELAYLSFRGMEFKYSDSTMYQSISLIFRWIQIDNQLYGGLYPIVLYPTVVPKDTKETEIHPTLHASLIRVKDDAHGILYVKYASILLQEMSLELDEDFLWSVFEFSKFARLTEEEDSQMPLIAADDKLEEPDITSGDNDIYFEILHIQPLKLNISFVRTQAVNAEDRTSSRNPLMFFFNVLTMAIGNINDAPIKLNALAMENTRASTAVLLDRITKHYGQEFFSQVHKILGSADFLGNPVGLFNNLSSGVVDIFYEPYQGFVMNDRPQDLGIGLARGTASFLKKSVFGFTDSFAKVTGSLGKGLSAATMDKAYQDRRRMTQFRNKPKHALYGVTAGATQLAASITSGIEGVVMRPIEGAEQGGAAGMFKGMGKGLVGLVTKPVVGVLDLASNVTEGIRNTTTVFDANDIDRVRLPRFIGREGILRPYEQREALGQSWLKQLEGGQFFKEEYVAHLDLPGQELVVMLTLSRIICVRSRRLKLEYEVPFNDIKTIQLESTGISLILRGGVQGPFVPISDNSSRQWFFNQIQKVVVEYNSTRRPVD